MKVSTKQLLQMVASGQLMAADVLPKVAVEMKKVANSGGALEKRLNSTRVAQGRFNRELEVASNTIFGSGANQGMANLFNELADSIKSSESALKGLGQIFKLFVNIIRGVAAIVLPVLETMTNLLGMISSVFNELFSSKLGTFLAGITAMTFAWAKYAGVLQLINKLLKSQMALKLLNLLPKRFLATIAVGLAAEDLAMGRKGNVKGTLSGKYLHPEGISSLTKADNVFIANAKAAGAIFGGSLGSDAFGAIATGAVQAKDYVFQPHIYIDGVKKSVDEHMTVKAEQSVVAR